MITIPQFGVKTVRLETLVELKLASGSTSLGRCRDLADVQDLIHVLALDVDFAERLDDSVQPICLELQDERNNPDAPDADA